MIGQTISHYRILEHLGTGGMGTVYRAEDTRLHRPVALKLLPEDVTVNAGDRKRLAREAESAAQLNHPNIATVYDFDEFDDTTTKTRRAFIAMEYVEGNPLKKRIADGPLSFDEATSILVQIARALQSAHQRGIVHRDVKPGNIVLTPQGTAKLLDFGIAHRAGETRVTGKGEVSGSIAYMAPEQLRDEHVDARADIWAFGVVAFEMLTQKKPFRGEHPAALMYTITNEDAADIAALRANVPEALRSLCRRCLQKDPEDRPVSMDEILALLKAGPQPYTTSLPDSPLRLRRWKRMAAVASPFILIAALLSAFPSIPTTVFRWVGLVEPPKGVRIAVLRFVGTESDSNAIAMADGLTELINDALRCILRQDKNSYVYASSDVFNARYKVASVGDVRKMFRVTHVVQGTIHPAQKRITLALIDAADGRQEEAGFITYTRLNDPGLQEALLSTLARMLHRTLPAETKDSYLLGVSRDTLANGMYRQGIGFLQRYENPDNLEAAIMDLGIAVARDSGFAQAHAALASAYYLKYRSSRDTSILAFARRSCVKALALNNQLPDAYVTLGNIHLTRGQNDEALDDIRRALALDSTNADACVAIARTLAANQVWKEAERWYLNGIRMRPESWIGYNALGGFYFNRNRLADAAREYRLGIEWAPENYWLYSNLGSVYLVMDSLPQAISTLERSTMLRGDDGNYSNLATAYWRMGKYPEAARNYERALSYRSSDYRVWGNLASAYQMIPGTSLEMGNAAKRAIEHAERELSTDPRNSEVMADLASYHALLGHKEQALALLKSARARGERDPNVLANIANTYEELGDRTRAIEAAGDALRLGYAAADFERSPRMKNLCADIRYKRIKDRMRDMKSSTP